MAETGTLNLRLYDIAKKKLKLSDNSEYKSMVSEDLLRLELKLSEKIHNTKTDLYKAMFLTGIVQLLAILGGVLAIVKFVI